MCEIMVSKMCLFQEELTNKVRLSVGKQIFTLKSQLIQNTVYGLK